MLVRWNLEKFTGAILCYEIGRVFASNFEKTRRKAWGTHCFNSTCYAVAIDGELFPVVLGLFTMAVLVCKKSCENLPLNPRPSHRSQIRLANIPVFVKGYGNGGHNRRFAKCWEDFAASRPCSK